MKAAKRAKLLPVRGTYDVIVAGGGLGGIAAALASARSGARTLLVERNSMVGGVATAGMCCSMFNCFYTSTGKLGSQGIAVEVADRLAKASGYGSAWHDHKGHIIYDLEKGALVLLDMLEEAGVEILLAALTVDVIMNGNHVIGVVIESKSGREMLLAKAVVDATGDADVAAMAGALLHSSENNLHSLIFRLGNVDVDAFVDFFRQNPEQYPDYMDVEWTVAEALAQYDACGTFLFPHGGGLQMDAFKLAKENGDLPAMVGNHNTTDACQMHALRETGIVHVITGFVRFDGLDITRISQSINDGRHMAFTLAEVYRKYIPGFSQAFIVGIAANLGVRVSRWLDGDFVLTRGMTGAGVRCQDAVGRAVGWNNVIKHPGEGAWGMQAMHGGTFDLPYRALLPAGVEGLIMGAGRSISTEIPGLLRVMVHTMVVGQAAGTAAAIAVKMGLSPRETPIPAIQHELSHQGVDLD